MTGDQRRLKTAMAILAVRRMRCQLFPSEIFDEHAWTMLLQLFVSLAENQTMTETALVHSAGASVGAGQRWIAHLVKDGQVVSSESGEDVALTGEAIERMRRFLDFASSEAQKIEGYKAER